MSSYRGDGVHVNETLWAFLEAAQSLEPIRDDDTQNLLFALGREFPGFTPAALYQIAEYRYGFNSEIAHCMAAQLALEMTPRERLRTDILRRNNPNTDEFLRSFEWRRVRMMVLERDGAKCSCCGRTASDNVTINVDHIKSRKRFPELALDPDNLQVLCSDCNHGKGNHFNTDWRRGPRC